MTELSAILHLKSYDVYGFDSPLLFQRNLNIAVAL